MLIHAWKEKHSARNLTSNFVSELAIQFYSVHWSGNYCILSKFWFVKEKRCRIFYFFLLFSIVASLLLNNLFGLLTTEEYLNCKAVYLHVLTTNYVALRFYERHKFRLFRYMPCYYAIKGRQKNGYLYVLYINGGKPPWTFSYPLICIVIYSCCMQLGAVCVSVSFWHASICAGV